MAIAGHAISGRSVIRQVPEESVLATLTLRPSVSRLALAAELTPVVDGAGAGEVPLGRGTLARLAGLACHRPPVKSGCAELAIGPGGVFSAVL